MENQDWIIEVDPELATLLPQFIKERWKVLTKLKKAVKTKNLEVIQVLGHQMRGTPGVFGFYPIVQIGQSLEDAASGGDPLIFEGLLEEYEYFLRHHTVTINKAAHA